MAGSLQCVGCLVSLVAVVVATGKPDQQAYQNTAYKNTEYKATDYKDVGYKGTAVDGEDDSQLYVYPAGFKGGRYYYGGIYRGAYLYCMLMK